MGKPGFFYHFSLVMGLFSLVAVGAGSRAPVPVPSPVPVPAPTPVLPVAPMIIGVISDLNGTECQPVYPRNSVVAFDNLLREYQPSHIIMPGDLVHGECLSYSRSKPYADVVREMWQTFEKDFFAKVASGTSITAAPGNHDAPWITSSSRSTFKTENEGFKNFWNRKEFALGVTRLKLAGAEDQYPYYWAYTQGDVLFVTLQSTRTSSLSDGVRQKAWLRAVLSSPEAQRAKARIVYGHVPPYPVLDPSVGSKYSAVLGAEQVGKTDGLMDLLLDHDVDLLVVAHSHAPYPGELQRRKDGKTMKILSMPCGHAARKLYSHSAVSPRGFAVLKVAAGGEISMSIKAWDKGQEVPFDYFPASIDVKDSRVIYRLVSQSDYR